MQSSQHSPVCKRQERKDKTFIKMKRNKNLSLIGTSYSPALWVLGMSTYVHTKGTFPSWVSLVMVDINSYKTKPAWKEGGVFLAGRWWEMMRFMRISCWRKLICRLPTSLYPNSLLLYLFSFYFPHGNTGGVPQPPVKLFYVLMVLFFHGERGHQTMMCPWCLSCRT